MEKGDLIYALIPFRFRKMTFYKYHVVRYKGRSGNNKINIVSLHPKFKFAISVDESMITLDYNDAIRYNDYIDNTIREFFKYPDNHIFNCESLKEL